MASVLAIIARFALLWQALVQLSGKEGTEKYCHRQFPALDSVELRFRPSSPSRFREFFFFWLCVNDDSRRLPSVIRTVPVQKQLCRGLVVVLPISIFNSCLSTTLIYLVFCHLLEEVDSTAIISLSFLTSLCGFVAIHSHEELSESRGDSGWK